MTRYQEQMLPMIIEEANEAGYRLEIVNGLGVWEFQPALRHYEASRRIAASVKPQSQGGDCACYTAEDIYVRFPDDSLRRPDVVVFCRRPDEQDEAVTEVVNRGSERKDLELSPPFYLAQGVKDVIVLDPYTGIVWHHRTEQGVERHQSPVDLSLRCGCFVTV